MTRPDPSLLAGYAVATALCLVAVAVILAAGWRLVRWVLG